MYFQGIQSVNSKIPRPLEFFAVHCKVALKKSKLIYMSVLEKKNTRSKRHVLPEEVHGVAAKRTKISFYVALM